MKLNKFFTLLLAGVSLAFSSCNDDNEEGPAPISDACQIYQTNASAPEEPGAEYAYDKSGKLVLLQFKEGLYSKGQASLEYRTDGKLAKLTITGTLYPDGFYDFEYDDQKRLTKTTYTIEGTPNYTSSITEFEYNSANKISKSTTQIRAQKADGTIFFIKDHYNLYTYDERGNVTVKRVFDYDFDGVATLFSTTNYTFDNSKNPEVSLSSLISGISNPNNILTAVQKNGNGVVDAEQSYSIVYGYNQNNYPEIATRYNQNGTNANRSFAYQCK